MQVLSILIALAILATVPAWVFFLIKPNKYPQKAGQPRSRATISLHLFGLSVLLTVIFILVLPKNTKDTAPAEQPHEQIQLAEEAPQNEPEISSEDEAERQQDIAKLAAYHKLVVQALKTPERLQKAAIKTMEEAPDDRYAMYLATNKASQAFKEAWSNPPKLPDFSTDETEENAEKIKEIFDAFLWHKYSFWEKASQVIDENDNRPSTTAEAQALVEKAQTASIVLATSILGAYGALGVDFKQIDYTNGGLIGETITSQITSPNQQHLLPNLAESDISEEGAALITSRFDSVLGACPGIQKYAQDLTFERAYDNFALEVFEDPEIPSFAAIVYKVSDNPQSAELRQWGAAFNSCFFAIAKDGETMSITKSPCQSLCLAEKTNVQDDLILLLQ